MPTTNVDTVTEEGLIGAPDHDVVAAATAAGMDPDLAGPRAGRHPRIPAGSHAGIVVLRLTDQSATAATKPVSDLATLTNPDIVAGAVAVLQRGLLCIRSRPPQPRRYRHLVLVPWSD